MVLRSICRIPMGVFDEYRALSFKYPRVMNFYMLYAASFFVLFIGKGYEKLTFRSHEDSYEAKRRARRLFIPYSLLSYKYRFPVNTN